MMASVGKTEPLPYARTFQVDTYAVLKVQFWPNQQHGVHAAIITAHGCWMADLSTNPGGDPSRALYTCHLMHSFPIRCTVLHASAV